MLDKSPRSAAVNVPNDLAAHWMPFTANRAFKKAPRLLAGANKAGGSGPNFSPDEMRRSLELITGYTTQQKLIPREFSVDELFDDVTRPLR